MARSEDVLQELGLSQNEVKVYLKLLLLGQSSGGQVADAAQVHRANAYQALDRLVSKGLVRYITEKNVKQYQAVHPTAMVSFLDEKRDLLDSVLPELIEQHKLSNKGAKEASISVHEGLKASRSILYNLLTYKESILISGVPAQAPEVMRYFIEAFHKERIRKKISMYHIYNEGAEQRITYLNSMPYTEARHLPKEYDAPTSMLICGEETILVLWHVVPVTFVRIKDKLVTESYKKNFALLWEKATV